VDRITLPNIKIFNRSTITLTPLEEAVLGLGLKFLPTNPNQSQSKCLIHMNTQLTQLNRRLQWAAYWERTIDTTNHEILPPQYYTRSDLPQETTEMSTLINAYISECRTKIANRINTSTIQPLSKIDKLINSTLTELSKLNNITIKPADKNIGIVILDTLDYISLCNDILSDKTTYNIITDDTYVQSTFDRLDAICIKHSQKFKNNSKYNTTLYQRLTYLNSNRKLLRTAYFYGIPKLHKPTPPLKVRPIISTKYTPTEATSQYLHSLLQPILKLLPTVAQSTTDILKDIITMNPLKPNAVIVCLDVKNMYPSIPIPFGLHAVRTILTEHCNILPTGITINFVIDLLEWVLKNNYFTFNNDIYLQIQGTAMGTNIAPVYAQIVMAYLEREPLQNNNHLYYKRFMDDIISIFHNEKDATKFIKDYNNVCPHIQLDPDSTTVKHDYGIILDLQLHVRPCGKIETSIYQKPLNSYLYIPFTSDHPHSQLRNWIREEIRRYRLYCTSNYDFFSIIMRFRQRLIDRGYNNTFLDPLFEELPNRKYLLENRVFNTTKRSSHTFQNPMLITTLPKFNPPLNLGSLLAVPQYLKSTTTYKRLYNNNDLIIGHKNTKSIYQHVVKGRS
jgi:hypothetical protein